MKPVFEQAHEVRPELAAARRTPDQWAEKLSAPPDISSDHGTWSTALLRHWKGTSPDMDQPPLDHHYIVQHLGGAKRVDRKKDGEPISTIVECGALTIVPAGTQYQWRTEGTIEFAHLYISPAMLEGVAKRFDRLNALSLVDRVGIRNPFIEMIYSEMLKEVNQKRAASPMYLDSLLESFLLKLLLDYSNAELRSTNRRETLPAFRLKRVVDFVEEHLEQDISLSDLSQVAGGSMFHFSRAFKNASGETPCKYLEQRRVERAQSLLTGSDLSLEDVAMACGFQNVARFSRAFSRLLGISPARYRKR